MQLGSYIKSRRLNLGLTQAKLAQEVGLTNVTISRYENDEREPSVSDWLKICKVLGLKQDDFIESDDK